MPCPTSIFTCLAVTVAVAWLSTPATNLRFRARERFVSKVQTSEALHRSTPGLESPDKGRLSINVDVLALQKLRCVGALGHVHDNRSVCLCYVLPAEPRYLCNPHLILLLQDVHGTHSKIAVLVQHRRADALSTLTGYHWSRSAANPLFWSFRPPPSPVRARCRPYRCRGCEQHYEDPLALPHTAR